MNPISKAGDPIHKFSHLKVITVLKQPEINPPGQSILKNIQYKRKFVTINAASLVPVIVTQKKKKIGSNIMDLRKLFKPEEDNNSTSPIYQFYAEDLSSPLTNVCIQSPQSGSSISSDHDYLLSPQHNVLHLEHWKFDVIEEYTFPGRESVQLVITEQPVEMFRFRYTSEMSGTHGCLLGRGTFVNKQRKKTYPTVKLVNHTGMARIFCNLVQNESSPKLHPHRLVTRVHDEKNEEPHECIVGPDNDYVARFSGMSIIHTAKKKVGTELFIKRKEFFKKQKHPELTQQDKNDLMILCENEAKNMNLNSVRLCFTAYDEHYRQICNPILSEPIDNLKCAETGILKINRMSKVSGTVHGGEEVFMFVEKVSKKNIKVRFFELEGNERRWESFASFSESDVHHQFGIIFTTPPYRDAEIRSKVKVYVELYRPKDGAVSDPKPFEYKPAAYHSKRRRQAENSISEFSSLEKSDSLSDREIRMTDLPLSVTAIADRHPKEFLNEMAIFTKDINMRSIDNTGIISSLEGINRVDLIDSPLNSTDLQSYLISDTQIDHPYLQQIMVDGSERSKTIAEIKVEKDIFKNPLPIQKDENVLYSKVDIEQANKAISTLQLLAKTKPSNGGEIVSSIMEEKLSSGDCYLHFFVAMKLKNHLKTLLDLIKRYELTEILMNANDRGETALHTAIILCHYEFMDLLLLAGFDPNLNDNDGNTPLHLAVKEDIAECMVQLLDQSNYKSKHAKPLDLDVCNNGGWTALHLAAMRGTLVSVSRLTRAGADCNARGKDNGRTPLHLAVANGHVTLVNYLLQYPVIDVNAEDFSGLTALHLACSSDRSTTLSLCTRLLEAKADPMKKFDNQTALDLAKNNINPMIYNEVKKYLPASSNSPVEDTSEDAGPMIPDIEIYNEVESCLPASSNSPVEDTAVDGVPMIPDIEIKQEPSSDLPFLDSKTLNTLSKLLNKGDAWKMLADEIGYKDLISVYESSKWNNPSSILLHLVEAQEKVTLTELHDIMVRLELTEAADAISKIIKD